MGTTNPQFRLLCLSNKIVIFKPWHKIVQQSILLLLAREVRELTAHSAAVNLTHRTQPCRIWTVWAEPGVVIRCINSPRWGRWWTWSRVHTRIVVRSKRGEGRRGVTGDMPQLGSKVHPGSRARGRAAEWRTCNRECWWWFSSKTVQGPSIWSSAINGV